MPAHFEGSSAHRDDPAQVEPAPVGLCDDIMNSLAVMCLRSSGLDGATLTA
jgi:hypothetical protein